jgi:organic radical activating enzyme
MSKTLNILRITGGEPLMHRSTWRLFDHLRNDPKPNLELNLNSNLGTKSAMVERLAENVNDLLVNKKVKTFKLFSSMDTWGKRAEYLRTGLNIELWEKNLDIYVTTVKKPVTFMCTFNILSVTSFTEFLAKVLEWRSKYDSLFTDRSNSRKIRFDTPYLKEPLQYDMHILPKEEYLPHFDKILKFIDDNRDEADRTKFSDLEYERFRRVRDYFANVQYDEHKVKEGRIDFYNWFTEYDFRRNVSFTETFPDMINFWLLCKRLASE